MTATMPSERQILQQKKSRNQFVRSAVNKINRAPSIAQKVLTRIENLSQLCKALHTLAQKYVPRTPAAFQDFDVLTRATVSIQNMGIQLDLSADMCAPTKSADNAVIYSSVEYRYLRNKFIAALSTIADMTDKNSPAGSSDYQRGVREGYRRASDIAILFLEDVQRGGA